MVSFSLPYIMITLSFSFTHTDMHIYIQHTHTHTRCTHTSFDISLRYFSEVMRAREGCRGALMREVFFQVGLGEDWGATH